MRKGRATNGAAIAMKARIVLYQNDDTKMKEIASQLKELITDPAYQYDLIPDYKFFLMMSMNGAKNLFLKSIIRKSGTRMIGQARLIKVTPI